MGCQCLRREGAPTCCCSRVEWAMWGNINALYAAVFIFSGGIVAASIPEIAIDGSFPTNVGSVARWLTMNSVLQLGIAFSKIPFLIGLFIFFVEYPRSARKVKKTNVERPGQKYIAPILHNLKFVGSSYIVRFILYLILLIPGMFVLSTIFGSMALFCACVCYFAAALNGESWKAPTLAWGPGASKKKEETHGKQIPDAPSVPPPRPPQVPTTPPPRPPQ